MWIWILLLLLAGQLTQVTSQPALADESGQFTKIQDLNPNSVNDKNRPIKQKWAVVIGISKFKDSRLNDKIPNDKAARQFYDYLIDSKSGRFAPDHVRLLTDDGASQANILNTLGGGWLGPAAGKDDLVVVFVATNSFPTMDGDAFLCSYNCALDNIYSTCLPIQSLMKNLRDNIKSDRVVLILQSGCSGAAELNDPGTSKARGMAVTLSHKNVDLDSLMLGKGYIILASSKADEVATSDAFSENLITALKEKDGLVKLSDAFASAKERTVYDTTHTLSPPRPQTPLMKTSWTGNELVLGVPPLESAALPAKSSAYLGAESHYLKASQLAARTDLSGAIAEYKMAIAVDPSYADAVGDYGAILGLQSHWKEATEQLKQAVELRPQDVLFRANYARALEKTGDREESVNQLEYAYTLNPKDTAVLQGLASQAISAGDVPAALRLLGEACKLYPQTATYHDRLAYVESMAGNLDAALAEAQAAVKLNPKLISARLNLGSIFFAKSDWKGASDAYKYVVEQDPANSDGWYLLSKALQQSGPDDKTALRSALTNFIAAARPGDSRLPECRQKLSALSALKD